MSAAPRRVMLRPGADLAGFRAAVRVLVADGVPPEAVAWSVADAPDLFGKCGGVAHTLDCGAEKISADSAGFFARVDLPSHVSRSNGYTTVPADRPPSPRGRGEDRADLVVGAVSPKGDGEGVSPDAAHPAPPPHPRLPPRLAPGKGGSPLSPPEVGPARLRQTGRISGKPEIRAGRGDAHPPLTLPRAVADLVPLVVCHRDPARYALLHALIARVRAGERHLMEVGSDPLVHRLHLMRKAVARDLHKMHAFLRFRRVEGSEERFVAWFEPDHHILEAAAPFFVERFRALDWSILTPEGSAHWDGDALRFGPPARRGDAPETDAFAAGWQGYYESTFNPARANPRAMRAEMPKKYWRNLPETAAIPAMLRAARPAAQAMIERRPSVPARRDPVRAVAAMADQDPKTLEELNAIIARTEPLVPGATQAVLGEGPVGATLAFVGEQPGDQEDRQGRPFVGPAGQVLSRAMREAGIERERAYLTNAVKHFKFEERGKRRIHQKPTAGEVAHYRWWLDRELDFVAPKLVVALGATAVLALTGKAVPITRARGPFRFERLDNRFHGFITVHPSYLLRLPDEAKEEGYAAFLDDMRRIEALARDLAA